MAGNLKSTLTSKPSLILIGLVTFATIGFVVLGVTLAQAGTDDEFSKTESTLGKKFKPGELIFHEDFNKFDLDIWEHEITMSGGGNWEFQFYDNNRSTSYTKDGKLFIKPVLTSEKYGEAFLSSGHLQLGGGATADQCTNPLFFGCERRGTPTNLINPVMSARIRTLNSFAFKYGKVEAKAKMPAGDWLWPAIWMMPQKNSYGGWPASGEIDILESRGNKKILNPEGKNVGCEQVGSTLHFGPFWPMNAWAKAHFELNSKKDNGFDLDFHTYVVEWTPEHIKYLIDNKEIGKVEPGTDGFWGLGEFPSNIHNPWHLAENPTMAPFDQKFYIIINLAVGGTNGYFPDNNENPSPKPWRNTSPNAFLDFWNGRTDWLPTWKGEESALQVDYIKVWAL